MRDSEPGKFAADSVLDSGADSYSIPGAKDSLREGGNFSSGSCRAWNSVNALERSSNCG